MRSFQFAIYASNYPTDGKQRRFEDHLHVCKDKDMDIH